MPLFLWHCGLLFMFVVSCKSYSILSSVDSRTNLPATHFIGMIALSIILFTGGIYHLAPNGQAGFVLAKGALTSKSGGEGDIRRELVKQGFVDCIVNLPAKLFLNTQIPASLWFLSRNRNETERFRERGGEILFIDARNMGHLINRRTREFSAEDIKLIADTYHNWRNRGGDYEDVAGFCASVSIDKVAELDYVLTPGRYVGLSDEEDDFNFAERFTALKAEFEAQLKEEERLNKLILENLEKIKFGSRQL